MDTSVPAEALKEEDKFVIDEKIVSCDICLDVLYNPLNVTPCNHKFCASCIRQWHDSHPICPRCRVRMEQLSKDSFVQEVLDVFLKNHPDRVRSEAARRDADHLEQHFREKNRDRWRSQRIPDSMANEDYWLGRMAAELFRNVQRNRMNAIAVIANQGRGEIRVNGELLVYSREGVPAASNHPEALVNRQLVQHRQQVVQLPVVQNRDRPIPVRAVDLDETVSSDDTPRRRHRDPPPRHPAPVAPPERRAFRHTSARRQHAQRQEQQPARAAPYRAC